MSFTPHNQTTQYPAGRFKIFFEEWIAVQKVQLDELMKILKSPPDQVNETTLRELLDGVMKHYEQYYKEKARAARPNVFAMFKQEWTSNLEMGFVWIGGWRPTMAVQLLYSKSSIEFMDQLDAMLEGVHTGDLADMSPDQLMEVEKLQEKIKKEEEEISGKYGKVQMLFPDQEGVRLCEQVTRMMNEEEYGEYDEEYDRRAESMMGEKEMVFLRLLLMADNLRLKTLKDIVELLSLKQKLQFLTTAASFHVRIHKWGIHYDEKKLMGN